MAHLTKPTKYDIKDSNIALLGSDLEKRVREHAGDKEAAWEHAGQAPGIQIWRIEKFKVVEWPADRNGTFYDGDSYLVLHTYKKDPKNEALSYDLHFWLGENTTQDEAGTAAYKTVELDDHLHGAPVQYREVQGYESPRFLSYFPRFVCLQGGVATGFHHVTAPPPLNLRKLYRITLSRNTQGGRPSLVVREVPPEPTSLVSGDVYVLDKGMHVWQFNAKASVGQERFKAAEFTQSLVNKRKGQCDLVVFDEGGKGASKFLSEFGATGLIPEPPAGAAPSMPTLLFRLSDSTGTLTFTSATPVARTTLSSDDVFLLDAVHVRASPAIYVWIGSASSRVERKMALEYAQRYLHRKQTAQEGHVQLAVSLVKFAEGQETTAFKHAIEGDTGEGARTTAK